MVLIGATTFQKVEVEPARPERPKLEAQRGGTGDERTTTFARNCPYLNNCSWKWKNRRLFHVDKHKLRHSSLYRSRGQNRRSYWTLLYNIVIPTSQHANMLRDGKILSVGGEIVANMLTTQTRNMGQSPTWGRPAPQIRLEIHCREL